MRLESGLSTINEEIMTIKNFDEKLKKYAELIVQVGLNVQEGQKVVVRAGHNTVALVREIPLLPKKPAAL